MFSKSRFFLSFLVVLLLALSLPSLVSAGGWAVITLDRLPEDVVAGQPYELGFTVRQHGRTPWQVNEIAITARQPKTGEKITFTAKPEGEPGHYRAELLFPQTGDWEWGIESGLFPTVQAMPMLKVVDSTTASPVKAAAASAGTANTAAAPGLSAALLPGLLAALAFAAGVALVARGRAKASRLWAGAGLVALCAGLAFSGLAFAGPVAAPFSTANAMAGQAPLAAQDPSPATVETGKQLFIAKGCVVCHHNTRALQPTQENSVGAGPDLSAYHNDPAYLKTFLANPQAGKATPDPNTYAQFYMPNLGLSADEIDALVSFINSDGAR